MGSAFAALGAIGFGIASTFARLAYGAGATPLTLVTARTIGFVLLVGGLILLLRQPFRLTRLGLRSLPFLGVAGFFMSVGYLSAVAYIPVSLAVLLLYTGPFMVGLISAATGRESLTAPKLVALVVAFLGLALAIGPEASALDPRGIAWALAAALAIALQTVFARSILHENKPLVLNWYAHLALLPLLLVFGPLVGSYAIPQGLDGLGGAGGSILGYILGYVCWFLALTRIAAIRVALVFNLEPLVTFAAAALLLGERLTLQQSLGSALVLAAIIGQSLWRERAAR
ncbi:MAG: DMT family transporter [Dongiaceae bacterium]